MEKTPLLKRIRRPADLRDLSWEELSALADEVRSVIIQTVSKNGGHLSPSLGVVELTIALHRAFHAPDDRILWDVGHQTYAHKLLTGRAESFHTLRQFNGLSGFCRPAESEYDSFISGHAGNAVSAAMGFEVANELTGKKDRVLAVIGDGALINGISMEALNNLRSSCRRMIVILNDNKMSIGKSIGAIPRYLNSLITGRNYNRFKAFIKMMLRRLPGGNKLVSGIQQLESSTKSLFVPGVFFEEMGIRYIGPIDGHDIPGMVRAFEHVAEFNRPVLVHIITEKGHGCEYAKNAPEKFHGTGAFNPENGKTAVMKTPGATTFSAAFGQALTELAARDKRVVAITAAMASGCGITADFIRRFPDRFFDVGIAEEHALVFAGGLAAAGMRPVAVLYATFLQRALDCLFHDICLQNLPVLICVDRAGIVSDGPTHHGIYETGFLRAMPNLAVLEPECESTLQIMMETALTRDQPVLIRYARGASGAPAAEQAPPVEWGKAVCDREGPGAAIWTCGRELYNARKVADLLKERHGISAAVYNARFLKPFDGEALRRCAAQMPVVTIEDNCIRGGLGDIAAGELVNASHHGLHCFGWDSETIVQHGSLRDLRAAAGLLPEQIADSLATVLKKA